MLHNKKFAITLISILSCVSLLSVGYASWTIVSGSAEANGTITADDVMFSNNYVTVVENQKLLYCKYGFVERENNSHNLSNKGNLRVAIDLNNLDKFKEKFHGTSMGVEVNFKYKNGNNAFNLFDNNALPFSIDVYDKDMKKLSNSLFTINTNLNINTVKFDVSLTAPTNVYYIDYVWTNNDKDALKLIDTNWFRKSNIADTLGRHDLFSFNVKLESKGGSK